MSNNRLLIIIIGLLAVIALALGSFLLFFFFISPGSPEQEIDASWDRIQSAGKIVVGTSADYPPFEYYVSDFQLDGFDLALMDEIAQRLGVTTEYQNIAFDGLGSALQLGQIDLAVAAISVTSDREAQVDFSSIYIVTEDALLASDQAQLTVSQAQDLAGLRVGVQSGTVHERWAQDNLVGPGVISIENLLVYQQFPQAISDLQAGRLDVAITDLPPAQTAAEAGGLIIVAQGLNPQRMALALPKGATSLKSEIDRALAELHSEGIVTELARRYLDLEPGEILPTPTATPDTGAPVPTPTPGGCLNGLALVEHLNLDDQNMSTLPEMQPGQPFTKGWRVRNSGTCTWDSSYRLVYAYGNDPAARMGGQPLAITGPVAPGETVDLQLNLIAPLKPGLYQAFWQMVTGQGEAFGEQLPVGISVPAPATATPAPTQTPAPGINFSVDRTSIKQGECVVFSWQVENVREVYFYPQGARWQDFGVAGQGSRTECPSATTTYELRVVKQDGSLEVRQITIYVEQVVGAPEIARFTVNPEGRISLGQCVELRWDVRGEVSTVKLTANSGVLWEGAPNKGSLQNCPPGTGAVEYGLEAQGPGGSSRKIRTIQVVDAATPIPTPAPEAPVILSFGVSPNQVEAGGCVNVSWRTGGGTARVQLKRDGGVILDNASFEGSSQDCNLPQPGTVVYGIDAFNAAAEAVSQEEAVTVSEVVPDNPLAGTSWLLQGTIDGTAITISFGADGSLNGTAGCNSYSAQYVASGQTLAITPPNVSQSICTEPEGIMEQEMTFLSTLPTAGAFQLEGNTLIIQDNAGNTIMTFTGL